MRLARIDRGFYTQPIWVGLVVSGVYELFVPETTRLREWQGNALAVLLVVSAGVCLVGSALKDWRVAFRLELVGLVGVIVTLGVLAVETRVSLLEQFTFVGGLGALIQIGSIRLAWHLWRALREG